MKCFATKAVLFFALMPGAVLAQQDAMPPAEPAAQPTPVAEPAKTELPAEAVKQEAAKQEKAKPEPKPAVSVALTVESVAPAPVVPAADLYVPVVDSGVIVYAEPRNSSAMVGLIESGAGVSFTGEEQNGYMRIQGGSISGWADKQLLRKSTAEQIMGEAKKFTDRVTRPRVAITRMTKAEISAPIATDGRVVLYSASWCPYCDKARAYFQNNGVAFEEHDTEKSAKGRRDYEAMNGDGIPIVLVNNHKIVGWKQREFDRYYAGNSGAAEAQHVPAPVVQVARAVAAPTRSVSSEGGPAYAPKIPSGVIVYSQPTNKSAVGGLIKGSDQVIALGEEQNGYMRVQGVTGDGWVDKSLMKKL
ncbi:MAG: glutaredoxin domain-containing protein [Burkholderiales bacterium]